MSLPAAPAALLDADGRPLLGRFAGRTGPVDWSALAPPFARGKLWRRLHHKRWHYVALCTERVFCALAIVDLGWTSTTFAYAFDRSDGDMLANFSADGPLGRRGRVADHAGGASYFNAGRSRVAIEPQADGRTQVTLACDFLEIDACFGAPAAPLLLAAGTVANGAVHTTQKSSGMALEGEVRTWREDYDLAGGVASFDYSNGLLARDTAWRWASAHNLELGFNLQSGYFGGNENALWLDGQVHALAPAHFLYDAKDPLSQWHIFTEDDLLELYFTPEGARRDHRRNLLAASQFLQPVGTFTGWVRSTPDEPKRIVSQLMGVTEEHRSRW